MSTSPKVVVVEVGYLQERWVGPADDTTACPMATTSGRAADQVIAGLDIEPTDQWLQATYLWCCHYSHGSIKAQTSERRLGRTIAVLLLPATYAGVVERLHDQGFATATRLLSPHAVEAGRAELDRLLHEGGPGVQRIAGTGPADAKARKIKDVAHDSRHFFDVASSATLVQLMCAALESDSVRLFSSTAWMKPAGLGAPKPPHQDEAHWLHVQPSRFATCWLAFDAATVGNGCLHFEPSSHVGPILAHVREDGDYLIPGRDTSTGVPCELQPGDASLHLGRTVHWSRANHSPADRRGVGFAYCRGDATSPSLDLDQLPRFTA